MDRQEPWLKFPPGLMARILSIRSAQTTADIDPTSNMLQEPNHNRTRDRHIAAIQISICVVIASCPSVGPVIPPTFIEWVRGVFWPN